MGWDARTFARRTLAAALLCVTLGASADAPVEIPPELRGIPHLKVTEFDVAGASLPEIYTSVTGMLVKRPGKPVAGLVLTTWWIKFDNRSRRDAKGRCRAANSRVTAHFEVRFPRLADRTLAPAVLERWRLFRRTVEKHEAGHVRIAIAHARRMEQALKTMNCAQLATELPKLVARVKAEQRAWDVGLCDAYNGGDRSAEAKDSCGWPYLEEPLDAEGTAQLRPHSQIHAI
jgi:predicted secreted Zn-dependent protease